VSEEISNLNMVEHCHKIISLYEGSQNAMRSHMSESKKLGAERDQLKELLKEACDYIDRFTLEMHKRDDEEHFLNKKEIKKLRD